MWRRRVADVASSWPQREYRFVNLLTSDMNYLTWLLQFLALSMPYKVNTLVLSLDEKVHAAVRAYHGASVTAREVLATHVPEREYRHHVWLSRMLVTEHVLSTGLDVLVCDLDAVWLRDPRQMLSTLLAKHTDIIVSRAFGIPRQLARKWGAVACMGFVYWRATASTHAVVNATLRFMRQTLPDDQAAFNAVLDGWARDTLGPIYPVHSAGSLVGFRSDSVRVELLPTQTVYRHSRSSSIDLHDALSTPSMLVYHARPMEAKPPKPGHLEVIYQQNRHGWELPDEVALWREGMWRLTSTERGLTDLLHAWANGTACGANGCLSLDESIAAISHDGSGSGGSGQGVPPSHDLTASRSTKPPPFVFFIHMPKAAGSGLSEVLRRAVPGCDATKMQECALSRTAAEFSRALLLRAAGGVRTCALYACRGHASMQAIDTMWHMLPLGHARPVLVTMLRAPVSRLISEFHYARAKHPKNEATLQFLRQGDAQKQQQLFRLLGEANFSLLDYAHFKFEPAGFGAINNRQTWLLAGHPQVLGYGHSPWEDQLYTARRRLDVFDAIGLSERFEESVRLLLHVLVQRHVLESDILAHAAHLGATRINEAWAPTVATDTATACALARLNAADATLYHDAATAFSERLCLELGECRASTSAPLSPYDGRCGCEDAKKGWSLVSMFNFSPNKTECQLSSSGATTAAVANSAARDVATAQPQSPAQLPTALQQTAMHAASQRLPPHFGLLAHPPNDTQFRAFLAQVKPAATASVSAPARECSGCAQPPALRLAYKHMSKCAGTYLQDIVVNVTAGGPPKTQILDEMFLKEQYAVTPARHRGRFVIGSTRNPCDYYLSLWAYQAKKP